MLEEVFGCLDQIAAAFTTHRRTCQAAGDELTPERLSALRQVIWSQLDALPAADGAGIVAAPGVVAGRERHLEWWQRTGAGDGGTVSDEYARIRLNLDPQSIDLYDYLDMDWFTVPRETGRRHVYGPRIDFSGADRYVLTLTVPVLDGGEFMGVAGTDLLMSQLEPPLLGVVRSVAAPAVLVTAERRVIIANSPRWIPGARLHRLPRPADGEFTSVTEIAADSGWLLAAD
jgi:hypothetical protein